MLSMTHFTPDVEGQKIERLNVTGLDTKVDQSVFSFMGIR